MPHAFRIFKSVRAIGLDDGVCVAIGSIVEKARAPDYIYSHERVTNSIFDAGCDERLAVCLSRVLRNCFFTEKQGGHYDRPRLKSALINSGINEIYAEQLLSAIDPAVLAPRVSEIRVPITFAPGAGRVVMCDFTHLVKPEMQKERRAIVVSPRANNAPGRCTVIPVSKSAPRGDISNYFEFVPGAYPFFHQREPVWAVCDHVYTVALTRLWRVNVNRRPELPTLNPADFEEVRKRVGTALGLQPLTEASAHENVPALAGERAPA